MISIGGQETRTENDHPESINPFPELEDELVQAGLKYLVDRVTAGVGGSRKSWRPRVALSANVLFGASGQSLAAILGCSTDNAGKLLHRTRESAMARLRVVRLIDYEADCLTLKAKFRTLPLPSEEELAKAVKHLNKCKQCKDDDKRFGPLTRLDASRLLHLVGDILGLPVQPAVAGTTVPRLAAIEAVGPRLWRRYRNLLPVLLFLLLAPCVTTATWLITPGGHNTTLAIPDRSHRPGVSPTQITPPPAPPPTPNTPTSAATSTAARRRHHHPPATPTPAVPPTLPHPTGPAFTSPINPVPPVASPTGSDGTPDPDPTGVVIITSLAGQPIPCGLQVNATVLHASSVILHWTSNDITGSAPMTSTDQHTWTRSFFPADPQAGPFGGTADYTPTFWITASNTTSSVTSPDQTPTVTGCFDGETSPSDD